MLPGKASAGLVPVAALSTWGPVPFARVSLYVRRLWDRARLSRQCVWIYVWVALSFMQGLRTMRAFVALPFVVRIKLERREFQKAPDWIKAHGQEFPNEHVKFEAARCCLSEVETDRNGFVWKADQGALVTQGASSGVLLHTRTLSKPKGAFSSQSAIGAVARKTDLATLCSRCLH